MKMNPLFNRHLARIGRKPLFFWLLSAYLLGVTILVLLFTMGTSTLYGFGVGYTTMFDQFTQGRTLFWVSSILLLLAAMLLVPIFALGLISGERDRRTFDLLITTSLKPISIIMGKLTSVLISGIVFIIAPLPLLMIGVWLGGVTSTELVLAVLLLLTTALLCASIAIWLSARVKRTLVAVLIYYGMHIATIPAAIILVTVFVNIFDRWLYGYGETIPFQGMFLETLLQHGWLFITALHPIAAAVASEALALEHNSWWLLKLPLERTVYGGNYQYFGDVYLPSPWIVFTLLSLLVSLLLIRNTARYLAKPKKK